MTKRKWRHGLALLVADAVFGKQERENGQFEREISEYLRVSAEGRVPPVMPTPGVRPGPHPAPQVNDCAVTAVGVWGPFPL